MVLGIYVLGIDQKRHWRSELKLQRQRAVVGVAPAMLAGLLSSSVIRRVERWLVMVLVLVIGDGINGVERSRGVPALPAWLPAWARCTSPALTPDAASRG